MSPLPEHAATKTLGPVDELSNGVGLTRTAKASSTNMSDPLTQIYDTLPGYTDTITQLATVREEIRRRLSASTSTVAGNFDPVTDAVLELVLTSAANGQSLTKLDTAAAKIITTNQAATTVCEALTRAEIKLKSLAAEIIADNRDTVLRAMSGTLASIQRTAETLAPLNTITTPEAALLSRRYDDAEKLEQLLHDYSAIRLAQVQFMREQGFEIGGSRHLIAAWIKNPDDVFEDWAVWLVHGALEHTRSHTRVPIEPPWPVTPPESAEFALWAFEAGATLWVPTPEEYAATIEDLLGRAKGRDMSRREGDYQDPERFIHQSFRRHVG